MYSNVKTGIGIQRIIQMTSSALQSVDRQISEVEITTGIFQKQAQI